MSFTDSSNGTPTQWKPPADHIRGKKVEAPTGAGPVSLPTPPAPGQPAWTPPAGHLRSDAPAMPLPPPGPSVGEDVSRGTAAGVVQGTQGMGAAPGGVEGWISSQLAGGAEKLGWTGTAQSLREHAENMRKLNADIEQKIKATDVAIGKTTGAAPEGFGAYQPQTWQGRLGERVGEFLPGMAIPVPGGGVASRALGGLAEQAVGRIAGEAAGRVAGKAAAGVTRNVGEKVLAPAAGSIAGEKLGEAAGYPRLGAVAGAMAGGGLAGYRGPRIDPETLAAAGRQGVDLPVGTAFESPTMRQITKFAEGVPFAGEPVQAAAGKALEQIQGSKAAAEAGVGATSREAAGDTAKEAITKWMTGESAKNVSDAYDAAGKIIDPNIRSDLTNTRAAVADIAARRQASAARGPSRAVNDVLQGVQSPNGLTFDGIKDMRTRMGQKVDPRLMPADYEGGEVKQLYGALSQDLEAAAQNAGGSPGLAAFRRANQLHADTQARRAALSKLVGAQGDAAPEAVFDRIAQLASDKKGGGNVALLRQAHNIIGRPDWEELAGSIGSRLGRDPSTGETSLARFASGYNGLSDQGKALLFGSKGQGLRQTYDDLATLAKQEQVLRQFANPSGTGQFLATGATLEGAVRRPFTTAASLLAGRQGAQILSKPASAKAFSRFVRAEQENLVASRLRNRMRILRAGVAYNAAARNLGNTANIPQDELQ